MLDQGRRAIGGEPGRPLADTGRIDPSSASGGPGFRRLVYGGIRQSVIDRWNRRRVKAGLTAWDPDIVYHLRGVPDERIDIDIDTTGVALRSAGDAGAPHPVERHEQPRGHRGAAGVECLAGDRGDRVAAGPAGPGAHRRLRRPLTPADPDRRAGGPRGARMNSTINEGPVELGHEEIDAASRSRSPVSAQRPPGGAASDRFDVCRGPLSGESRLGLAARRRLSCRRGSLSAADGFLDDLL